MLLFYPCQLVMVALKISLPLVYASRNDKARNKLKPYSILKIIIIRAQNLKVADPHFLLIMGVVFLLNHMIDMAELEP